MQIFLRSLVTFTLGITVFLSSVRSELSEKEKRALFLRSRKEAGDVQTPKPTLTPQPSNPVRSSASTSTSTKRKNIEHTTSPSSATLKSPLLPKRKDEPSSSKEKQGAPSPLLATPLPSPPPSSISFPALSSSPFHHPSTKTKENEHHVPITIEKSGLEQDQGFVPTPKSSRGWFFGGRHYKYLTGGIRRAIDKAPVKRRRWKYIIIHNSGTRTGNARAFDNYHRRVRKMQNGLAYHFVIGNGSSSGNGEIEVGPRWVRQINGGHVASDYLNNIAIGICLVGDFNRDLPTKAQQEALDELISYLRNRIGKIKNHPALVRGHCQINPKPTDCPGTRFPLKWLKRFTD